jgi:integrase
VKGRRLKLTDSKTGPRLVWFGAEAQAILEVLPRKRGEDRVFQFEGEPESTIDSFWRQLRRRASLEDVRLHDLRHSFASYAVRSSETLLMIGNLLGHARVSSTQRYAHLDDDTVLDAAIIIGNAIETHCSDARHVTQSNTAVKRSDDPLRNQTASSLSASQG